ncbi:hypothetical protein [Saccharicrinis sp. FJH54]|uniref:hypothetical protein n=1 Tax=Saccharicrinis sp. FJH54 TaxID=3344665 RepID=UPI0035D3FC3A
MTKRLLTVLSVFIFIFPVKAYCQDVSFNEQKGYVFSGQAMRLKNEVQLASIAGYKTGKVIFFAGFEYDEYKFSSSNGLSSGIYLYPHQNKRKLKVFYQSFLSYRWVTDHYTPVSYVASHHYHVNIGTGLEYYIKPNFAIGINTSFGVGPWQDLWGFREDMSFKLGYKLSLKYFLFNKKDI